MDEVTLNYRGFTFDCAIGEDGDLTLTPKTDAPSEECDALAASVEADFSEYRAETPNIPQGFVDAYDELADWLRVNYGDEAVRVKRGEPEKGTVY